MPAAARPSAAEPPPGELRALTGARGLAAWAVVAFHLRAAAGLPDAIERIVAKGYWAVDFFFLLSGFVIWLSWAERIRGRGPAAWPAFLRRRIARIWPLHAAMLGVALLLAAMLVATGRGQPAGFPLAELPLHVLLVQDWGVADPLRWNDPAWSISAEWAAYLLFPLTVAAIDWRRLSATATVAAIAALAGLLHLVFAGSGTATLGGDIRHLGVIRCLVEFAIGGAVCSLYRRARRRVLAATGALALAGVIAGAVAWGALPETFGIPLAFAAGLLALALTSARAGNPLAWAPVHWLGEISYATYLSHFLLWFAFKLALVDDLRNVAPALFVGYAATLLAASAALYHGLEKPAQRALNRWRAPGDFRPRGRAAL